MQDFLQQHRSIVIGAISALVFLVAAGALYLYTAIPLPNTNESLITQTPRTTPQVVTVRPRENTTNSSKYLLPKSKVTPAYSSIYNAIANQMTILENVYENDMTPLLSQTQIALKNKDYQSLATIGQDAKIINDAQKARLAILSADFNNLAAVNKTLSDAETIRLTNEFITTGNNLLTASNAFNILIDNMISGNVSSRVSTETKTIMGNLSMTTVAFRNAAKKLSDFFTMTIVSDARAYLTASSTSI